MANQHEGLARTAANSAWLQRFGGKVTPRARLFCFPHAGGVATSFRSWKDGLPPQVELIAIQLPGRGGRLREPPIADIPALTQLLTAELLPWLDLPYVFFGHSMGAVLAHEVARALGEAGWQEPAHLFLSARRPPHLPRREPDLHGLPDDAFLYEIGARYGGVPPEVLKERELLALLLPALRADITALETFTHTEHAPLTCAISAFGGDEDALVTLEQLSDWRRYTSGPFRARQFRGGHFYPGTAHAELLSEVVHAIAPLLANTGAGRIAP